MARGSTMIEALYYKPEGSRPDGVKDYFFNLPNIFSRTKPWGLLIL
jgi:hypothetical protein